MYIDQTSENSSCGVGSHLGFAVLRTKQSQGGTWFNTWEKKTVYSVLLRPEEHPQFAIEVEDANNTETTTMESR